MGRFLLGSKEKCTPGAVIAQTRRVQHVSRFVDHGMPELVDVLAVAHPPPDEARKSRDKQRPTRRKRR